MKIGSIIRARLPRHVPGGREQEGIRPCVVVANPASVGHSRYAILTVVPLTTARGVWVAQGGALYPTLASGVAGLEAEGIALIDHVTDLDMYRIERLVGTLTKEEFAGIRLGLQALFQEALEP